MKYEDIENILKKAATEAQMLEITFKTRSPIKGIFIRTADYTYLSKKNLWRIANEKMDEEILKRLYALYELNAPAKIMPMSIHWLGNSSVATVPTLYDSVRKGQVAGYDLSPGDNILFASVGAGMNISAVCYRV